MQMRYAKVILTRMRVNDISPVPEPSGVNFFTLTEQRQETTYLKIRFNKQEYEKAVATLRKEYRPAKETIVRGIIKGFPMGSSLESRLEQLGDLGKAGMVMANSQTNYRMSLFAIGVQHLAKLDTAIKALPGLT